MHIFFPSFTQLRNFATIITFLHHIVLLKPDIRHDFAVDLNWWAEVRDCLWSAYKMAKRAFRFLSIAFSIMYLLIFHKNFKQTLLSSSHYIQSQFWKKIMLYGPVSCSGLYFATVKTSSSVSTVYSAIILHVFSPLDIFVFYCLATSNHCGFNYPFFDTDQQKNNVYFINWKQLSAKWPKFIKKNYTQNNGLHIYSPFNRIHLNNHWCSQFLLKVT